MAVTAWTSGVLKLFATGFIVLALLGLSLMEAGYARKQHYTGVLVKNIYQIGIGMIMWWLIGYGFAFGEVHDNQFIGTEYFAGEDWDGTLRYMDAAYYGLAGMISVFSLNISINERVQFPHQLLYTALIMGIFYPIVVAWGWGGGWLADEYDTPFIDYGGAAQVHLVGASWAVPAIFIVGKRCNYSETFQSGNWGISTAGALLFAVGMFFMNAAHATEVLEAGAALWNCILGGATCSLLTLIIGSIIITDIKFHFNVAIEGFLAGIIGLSGCAMNTEGWDAFAIGFVLGVLTPVCIRVEKLLNVDDMAHTLAWQFIPALFGTIFVGWFEDDVGIFHDQDADSFGVQLGGAAAIAAWSAFWSVLFFLAFRFLHFLRVGDELQEEGLSKGVVTWKGYRLAPPKVVS